MYCYDKRDENAVRVGLGREVYCFNQHGNTGELAREPREWSSETIKVALAFGTVGESIIGDYFRGRPLDTY